MAQRTMKIEDELLIRIQKLKTLFFERYRKNISLSEVVERVFDRDPLMMALLDTKH